MLFPYNTIHPLFINWQRQPLLNHYCTCCRASGRAASGCGHGR